MAKVLIIHEDEANVVFDLVMNHLKNGPWDLTDEVKANEARYLQGLRLKLEEYLDHGKGEDVIEKDAIRR